LVSTSAVGRVAKAGRPSFLAFHHAAPEIAVGLELGGESVVPEPLRKTHFAKVAILLDQRLDTPAEVIRKSLGATVEEDLVLDLQPADTIFQNRQFLINIHVESALIRLPGKNDCDIIVAYLTGST
jgi:hypothetical protein